jgi:hypothetical protein
MSFAVVIEGMTIAAFAILLAGGKQRREAGWGALTVLALISAVVQAISMALMVSYYPSRVDQALTETDIPFRDGRPVFPRMVPRQELVHVYCILGSTGSLCRCYCCCSFAITQ